MLLSLTTTTGFASLGYLINEVFDIRTDLMAGKSNRLAGLSIGYLGVLFGLSISVTLLPWLSLPANKLSYILISAELGSFLLYSLPFPRLKQLPIVSNLLDAAYAYIIPLALSFHTFSLFKPGSNNPQPVFIYLLLLVVALVGFRNILIHQVDDVFNDKRSGLRTLPTLLGPTNTTYLIMILLAGEVVITLAWILLMCSLSYLFIIWLTAYLLLLAMRLIRIPENFNIHFFSIIPYRHLTDHVHQIAFPFFTIIMATAFTWQWIFILPFHLLLVLPPIVWSPVKNALNSFIAVFPHYFQQCVIYPSTLIVNYTIFFSFLLVGINLKTRRQSAWQVISGLFKRGEK